jgi:hypothetical protein
MDLGSLHNHSLPPPCSVAPTTVMAKTMASTAAGGCLCEIDFILFVSVLS